MDKPTVWQLLFVDDDADFCRQIKEFLEGESLAGSDESVHVETLTDFADALEMLQSHQVDLLILDVRLGPHDENKKEEEVGVHTLRTVQQRRFVPVVFYTGLPHLVRHLESPLIRVVRKTEREYLLETIQGIFATRLPAVNRALIKHFELVQRDYMWDFVAKHWEQFGTTSDRTSLAYFLARRLAMSLSGPGIQQLFQDLGDSSGTAMVKDQVHPMEYYVMPPLEETSPLTGDIYFGEIGEHHGYWVLLTPSCDLVAGREKADWTLLAYCVRLIEQSEYTEWMSNLPNTSGKPYKYLRDLLLNNRRDSQSDRFFFLPGALTLPDLIVDFQQVVALQREKLVALNRLASLDNPFSESLLARFTRYFGRIGIPDLAVDLIFSRLRSASSEVGS